MNNQKAHTEADKERGDSLKAKCRHLHLTNNKLLIISYFKYISLVSIYKTRDRACNLDVRQRERGKSDKVLFWILVSL